MGAIAEVLWEAEERERWLAAHPRSAELLCEYEAAKRGGAGELELFGRWLAYLSSIGPTVDGYIDAAGVTRRAAGALDARP